MQNKLLKKRDDRMYECVAAFAGAYRRCPEFRSASRVMVLRSCGVEPSTECSRDIHCRWYLKRSESAADK